MKSILTPLLALLLVLSSAPAWADKAAQAKAAYQQGKEHFRAGEYREALTFLKKAFSLKPHPSLLRYMGDTYYKMNKARMAIKYYNKYLDKAPMAADKDRVVAKVKQLELIVGAGEEEEEEEETQAAPPPPPPDDEPESKPKPKARTKKPKSNEIDMRPTGEDTEDPLAAADRRRKQRVIASATRKQKPRDTGNMGLTVGKWVALAVGVAAAAASISLGVVSNDLANSNGEKLREMIKTDCLEKKTVVSGCTGNPNLNDPVITYQARHHTLLNEHKDMQTGSIISAAIGGAALITAVVLFVMDRPAKKKKRRAESLGSRVVVAPVMDDTFLGLAGSLRF